MKILILSNNIKDLTTVSKGINIVKQKALTIGLTLDFTLRDTNKQFTSVPFKNETNASGFMVDYAQIFQEGKTFNIPFDIVCLVFDEQKITPHPTNPVQTGQNMQIPQNWFVNYPEVFAEFFLHELDHYFFIGKPLDTTHDYLPQFNNRIDKYLFDIKNNMQKYKYFKDSEVINLEPKFVSVLDKMRGECGFPFKINSGFRTIAENAIAGGVNDSAHTEGLAVDIACVNSTNRMKLIQVALNNGITRIGIAGTFVHLDISKTLPQNVCWTY